MDRNRNRRSLGPVRLSAGCLSKLCPRRPRQSSTLAPRIVLLLVLLLAPVRAFAGSVTLAWDPVVSPLLAGYNLYFGPSTGDYTAWINAGNATILTVPNLVDGATYYFAVTSYDWSGGSSPFSNEVAATIPFSGQGQPTDMSYGPNYTGLWWAAPGLRGRMGLEHCASGRHDVRHLVHVRRQSQGLVARDGGEQKFGRRLLGNVARDAWTSFQHRPIQPGRYRGEQFAGRIRNARFRRDW